MILEEEHSGLTFFRMARTVARVPLFWTGAYLVDGLLVDCGPPATARAFLRALEGRPVDALVLTHHHEDHVGAAGLFALRGIVPLAHAAAVPLLAGGFAQETYRRAVWGKPPRLNARTLGATVETRSLRFEVISTPGHSPDHVCLFERERGWLFTGDLFLAERLRYLRSDEDLGLLIESLDAVCDLPLRRVFCAHRGPVRGGVDALRRKRDHLMAIRETIRLLLAEGFGEGEVARRAVGPEGMLSWVSFGGFSARNFVRSVRSGTTAARRDVRTL